MAGGQPQGKEQQQADSFGLFHVLLMVLVMDSYNLFHDDSISLDGDFDISNG